MGSRGPLENPLRTYVVALYARGELATLAEGGLIAGVSRVRVMAWLRAAGINWTLTRQRFIAKHRRRAVAQFEGRIIRRPSKRQMRRDADRAKAKWDADHAAELEK